MDVTPLAPLFAALPPGAARDQAIASFSYELTQLEPIADTAEILSMASSSLRRQLRSEVIWKKLRFAEIIQFLCSSLDDKSGARPKFALLESWLPVYAKAGKDGKWHKLVFALSKLPSGIERDQSIDEAILWGYVPADNLESLLILVENVAMKHRIRAALKAAPKPVPAPAGEVALRTAQARQIFQAISGLP